MVRGTLSFAKTMTAVLAAGVLMTAGCSTKSKNAGLDLGAYRTAVKQTADLEPMAPDTEQQAIERFRSFYAEYSAESIRSMVRSVYDDDAWFGDPYHGAQGLDAIEHYFLVMAEPVESCTFSVDSIQRSGIDYYAHWTMKLVSKAAGNQPIEAIGLSHVRFNTDGKIVFQQDYWDTSVMLDRLPVVGFWTRLVKGKITKGLEE